MGSRRGSLNACVFNSAVNSNEEISIMKKTFVTCMVLVALFAVVHQQHPERYLSEPRALASGSDELLYFLLSAGDAGCTHALRLAGIDADG